MNTRAMVFFTMVVATMVALFGTPGKAVANVVSGITVDSVTVTKTVNGFGMATYSIVATGHATLGTNDTYMGVALYFTDPNNGTIAPVVNFTRPAQGQTSMYTMTINQTATTGKWTAVADMTFMHTGNAGSAANSLGFTVGP